MYEHSGSYNEFVVSRSAWEGGLPGTIAAVMCRSDCDQARRIHTAFLRRYGRSRWQTPLVRYNENGGFSAI